jgi:hypothetical protein
MKKVAVIFSLVVLAFILFISKAQAQSTVGESYFIGKWSVLIKGLPDGDSKKMISFEKKDGKLIGCVTDPANPEQKMELTEIEVSDNALKANVYAQSMYVQVNLSRKDDNTITGTIMDRFDLEGTRDK